MAFRLGVAAIALIGFGSTSDAHWSASAGTSLYVARYLVCNEQPERDVRCAGPVRARAALLADLSGTAPSRGGADSTDLARRAAIYAVYFHVTDAIPQLRDHLARRPQPADRGTHREIEINGLRGEAAYALAHLGDVQSAPAIADLVLDFETTGHGFLWQDTLAALAEIDPPRASRYAIDFLGRHSGAASNWRTSMPGGGSKLKALDYVRREDARSVLPLLERLAKETSSSLANDHAHCQFMATRVRLDDKLRDDVRKQFLGNYSGTWLPTCSEAVFQQLGKPSQPDDAAALVRHLGRDDRGMDFGMANLAYQRIMELEFATRSSPDAAGTRAREVIRKGLTERSAWPHVAKPGHPNYSLHFVVLHQAALAGLGSVDARNKLFAIVDDPNDRGEAWLAALWAMRLNLRDYADHVGDLLVRGLGQPQQHTNGLFENIRTRVLDEFVARQPDDPRWAALVLDLDRRMVLRPSDTAERALFHLSRHAPRLACETIANAAASVVAYEATDFGLLALTVFGDKCRPALQQLADDPKATSHARGSALEILGAIGDPQLAQRIDRAAKAGVWRPALERARVWLAPRPRRR